MLLIFLGLAGARLLGYRFFSEDPRFTIWLNRVDRVPYWSRVIAFLVAVGALDYFQGDEYFTSVMVSVATYAMLGLGLNIVVGFAGLLDLGYAAFFAIGAYTSALLMTEAHWNFFATIPFAILFTGTAGAILGYPTLRLRSDYLAIVTLGFGEMTRVTITNWDYAGGPNGILRIPFPEAFGYVFQTQFDFLLVGLGLLAIAMIFAQHLEHSRLGRGWIAIREDEFAAESVGVPSLRLKLLAYVMGGMWGGLAGGFFATRIGAIDPTSFTFSLSVLALIVIVLAQLADDGAWLRTFAANNLSQRQSLRLAGRLDGAPQFGLLALAPFAYFTSGGSVRHIELSSGMLETMTELGQGATVVAVVNR